MSAEYRESIVKGHVVGVERLEPLRWRVSVDGRRMFTFCSEARAKAAGVLEARRLSYDSSAGRPRPGRWPSS